MATAASPKIIQNFRNCGLLRHPTPRKDERPTSLQPRCVDMYRTGAWLVDLVESLPKIAVCGCGMHHVPLPDISEQPVQLFYELPDPSSLSFTIASIAKRKDDDLSRKSINIFADTKLYSVFFAWEEFWEDSVILVSKAVAEGSRNTVKNIDIDHPEKNKILHPQMKSQ